MLIALLVELCELRFELLSRLAWFSANRWRFTEDLKNCVDKWFVDRWKTVALVEAANEAQLKKSQPVRRDTICLYSGIFQLLDDDFVSNNLL